MAPDVNLPSRLRAAIDPLLAGRGQSGLRYGSEALTSNYRAGGRSTESMDFGAYLAARLPATYAAVMRVLWELKSRAPQFEPFSLTDVGAGPGTASWAAAELWPGLGRFTLIDNNRAFLALARDLARQSGHSTLAAAEAVLAGMHEHTSRSALTVAAYALAETGEEQAGGIVRHLWAHTEAALVIVEPGTPAGFARIRRARAALIASGGTIAAPCTHAGACPMADGGWCHFSVRLPRSRLHMRAKAAAVPFEDERFSYVIATRWPVAWSEARIVAPPAIGKTGGSFKLCSATGLATRTIARRDAANYKRARKLDWGDAF